jgi:hypothetical protein
MRGTLRIRLQIKNPEVKLPSSAKGSHCILADCRSNALACTARFQLWTPGSPPAGIAACFLGIPSCLYQFHVPQPAARYHRAVLLCLRREGKAVKFFSPALSTGFRAAPLGRKSAVVSRVPDASLSRASRWRSANRETVETVKERVCFYSCRRQSQLFSRDFILHVFNRVQLVHRRVPEFGAYRRSPSSQPACTLRNWRLSFTAACAPLRQQLQLPM